MKLNGLEELPGHEMEVKDLPDEHFQKKTVGERFGIMAGGVVMNFISAVILIIIMYGIGKQYIGTVIGDVNGSAYEAGLEMNDKILSINDVPVKTFVDVQKQVILSEPKSKVPFKIERNGKEMVIDVIPDLELSMGIPTVGIVPKKSMYVGDVMPDSPSYKAGLRAKDLIQKVNGVAINEYYEFEELIENSVDKTLSVEVLREGQTLTFEMAVEPRPSYLHLFESGLQSDFILEIDKAQPGRAAYENGFRSGDSLLSIDGEQVFSIKDVSKALAKKNGGAVEVEVLRGEEQIKKSLEPRYSPTLRKYLMGVQISLLGTIRALDQVEVNGPASRGGLAVGDRIVSIDGVAVRTYSALNNILSEKIEQEVTIGYERNGETLSAKVVPRSPVSKSFFSKLIDKSVTLASGHQYIYDSLGLGVKFKKEFYLAEPKADSPAGLAGFKAGDQLLSFSYVSPVTQNKREYLKEQLTNGWGEIDFAFSELSRVLSTKDKALVNTKIDLSQLAIHVRYLRGEQEMVTSILPVASEENAKGFSGVYFDEEKVLLKYDSVGSAVNLVVKESYGMLEFTAQSFLKLISGRISSEAMSGPVGVISITHKYSKTGLIELIWLVAMLSINIGFLNFLPFPPLDGGAIFFLLIEKIKGSPVSAGFQIAVQNLGVLLLISLMLFVTINDVGRLF